MVMASSVTQSDSPVTMTEKPKLEKSPLAPTKTVKQERAPDTTRKRTCSAASSTIDTDSESEDISRNVKREKPVTMGNFSIQSILARPEPLRPTVTTGIPPGILENFQGYAAQFMQANLAAHCFPQKFPGQLFYPWNAMAMHLPQHELPENLSTKAFLPPAGRTGSMHAKPEHYLSHHLNKMNRSPNMHPVFSMSPIKDRNLSPCVDSGKPACTSPCAPDANLRDSKSPSPSPSDLAEGEADDREQDELDKSPGSSGTSSQNGNNQQRRKKTRTVFSRNQVFQLESTFDLKRYLSSAERSALASNLNLSEQQIKIWFQNRRNKWKRQLCSDMDAGTLGVGHGQGGRFPGHGPSMPMPLYPFPGSNLGGGNDNNGGNSGLSMPGLFCPGSLHPALYHLPFSRSTV